VPGFFLSIFSSLTCLKKPVFRKRDLLQWNVPATLSQFLKSEKITALLLTGKRTWVQVLPDLRYVPEAGSTQQALLLYAFPIHNVFPRCSECVCQDVPNSTTLLSHILFAKVEKGDPMIIWQSWRRWYDTLGLTLPQWMFYLEQNVVCLNSIMSKFCSFLDQ
jgi:hypothetical protein